MKRKFWGLATLLGGCLILSQVVQAQVQNNYVDNALLYTRQNPSGTARTLGLGGAGSTLGADFGSITNNPAGLGFYTKSEITFTPGLGYGRTSSSQIANTAAQGTSFPEQAQTANNFHVANAGIVFTSSQLDDKNQRAWRGGSFALGFTRLADFNQVVGYQATTDDGHSLFQLFREPNRQTDYTTTDYQSATRKISQQYTDSRTAGSQYYNLDGLAYGTGLAMQVNTLNPLTGSAKGDSIRHITTPLRSGSITQRGLVESKGSLSQFDLGYGGNFRNKLYIGGGIGIVSMNRTRTSTFSEESNASQDIVLQDDVKTMGTGFNARLGLIYRVDNALRVGASIQTPTFLKLNDLHSTTLTNVKFPVTGDSTALSTIPNTVVYDVTLPFRATGGATLLLGKYGLLTGDVEYVGYSQARFKTTNGSFNANVNEGNSAITTTYRNVVNVRLGAEGKFNILRARLGYARSANPYLNSALNRTQNYFTAGLGVRTKFCFVDLAGVYLSARDQYQPYTLASAEVGMPAVTRKAPTINITNNRFTASLTLGVLF